MLLKLIVLTVILAGHSVHGMMLHQQGAHVTHRAPLPTSAVTAPLYCPNNQYKVHENTHEGAEQSMGTAIKDGDYQHVVDHFSSTWYSILPWGYYHDNLANCLAYAVQQSPEKTDKIVNFLVSKVRKNSIARPECLLADAVENHHTHVVRFVQDQFGNAITLAALARAIDQSNSLQVFTLRDAGVPLGVPLHEDADSLPINVALQSFTPQDDLVTAEKKLAITVCILKHLGKDAIAKAHAVSLAHVPNSVCVDLKMWLNRQHIPTSECMEYKAPQPREGSTEHGWIAICLGCCPTITIGALLHFNDRIQQNREN